MRERGAYQGRRRSGGGRGPGRADIRSGPRRAQGSAILYGWHTVKAALENPARHIRRLMVTENAARRLGDEGVHPAIKLELVRPQAIAALVGEEAVHNGLYAEADPLPSLEIEEIARSGIVLVFDQITDP